MRKLILASASPRRKEIMTKNGYDFIIATSDKEEPITKGCSPEKFAVGCALTKASDVYSRSDKKAVVLGADTVVAYGDEIFGKPKDAADAERILKIFSGKTHRVITGYAVLSDGFSETGYVETKVTFNELSDDLIKDYIKSGLCFGKAGAYGIQDGYPLVKSFDGDYDNVVGLPISVIKSTLEQALK